MTTRADLRSRIRAELNDITPGNYLYDDTLLNSYIIEALHDWSDHNPLFLRGTLTPVDGQRSYILPANTLKVLSLEQPTGTVLAAGRIEYQREIGSIALVARSFNQVWGYDPFSFTLWLRYPSRAGDDNLIYSANVAYLAPVDDSTLLDLAATDEAAVIWFACMRALQWLETQREKRGDASRLPRATGYEKRYTQAVARAKQRKAIVTSQLQPQA